MRRVGLLLAEVVLLEIRHVREAQSRAIHVGWDWFDDRTSLRKLLRLGLYESVPVRGAWFYSLGSATLILITMQLVTGIFLMMEYVPSTTEAWSSLHFARTTDQFGQYVRALHLWGAYVLLFVIGLHMVRTFMSASYKRPRELNWLTGVILFLLVLGMAITGAFLPWDQAAYWTAVVVTNIPGYTPIIGPYLREIWRGGALVGPATLTRTFGIHVWAIPVLLFGVIGMHLLLLRKHGEFGSWVNYRGAWRSRRLGVAPPAPPQDEPPYPSSPTDEGWTTPLETEDFYPGQTFRDGITSTAFVLLVALLAFAVGAPLEARANPATVTYTPIPEWFYLPLDQMLVLLPGPLVPLALLFPLVGVVFLVLVPFLDRSPERDPFERPSVVIPGILMVLVMLSMTLLGAGRLFNL
jgi:quinol-cytochrome oxidoreductase complex cytochrome b subunit